MSPVSQFIAPKRLKMLPTEVRFAHEYCFFLHDECVRMLVEYEAANAHKVSIPFRNDAEKRRFAEIAQTQDAVSAVRALNRPSEARRIVLNTVTMAMVSDCMHHIYESLRCFEKRKFVPAFNLLRKPLLDNLMYLSWMVADEDDFHAAFISGDPKRITQKVLGNRRQAIIDAALDKTALVGIVDPKAIHFHVFDAGNSEGLYGLFQHAVHLVTVDRLEIRTSPENFNFIFSHPLNDELYVALYQMLPTVLLYLAHVIMALFERIKATDPGSQKSLVFRTVNAYRLLQSKEHAKVVTAALGHGLSKRVQCPVCSTSLRVTRHNAARLLLTDQYRCSRCQRVSAYPFSWLF